MSSLQKIHNEYADDFLEFLHKNISNQNHNCIDIHDLGTLSILDEDKSILQIKKNTSLTYASSGANGTIVSYKNHKVHNTLERTILMKFRDADNISSSVQSNTSSPSVQSKLEIVNLQDPTQYDIVNSILLDSYYLDLVRNTSSSISFPQFTKVITCSQYKQDSNNALLSTTLFVESVPGTVKSLMAYLKEYIFQKKNNVQEITPKIVHLMLDLYNLGSKIGFWHGDLHPGNILIKEDESLVVIDLGRAYIHPPMLLERIKNQESEVNFALKNACAKLWPCERLSELQKTVDNINVNNVYNHILHDVFHGKYSYFNRHGHLAQCMQTLGGQDLHENVYKTVVLADIGGLALSIFSQSYRTAGGYRCSLMGLIDMLHAYMPQPDQLNKWRVRDSHQTIISKIEISSTNTNTKVYVVRPIGLLERINQCQSIMENKDSLEDARIILLKEMACLWVLLYACITSELWIELPVNTRILNSSLTSAMTNIINSLSSPNNIHILDIQIIEYAFYVHGQPQMFTCDMFTILDALWKKVAPNVVPMQHGGKKRVSAKVKHSPKKRSMQTGGGGEDTLKKDTTGCCNGCNAVMAVLDALNYKPQSPEEPDITKKPERVIVCNILGKDTDIEALLSKSTTKLQTCAAAASENPARVPGVPGVPVMGGGGAGATSKSNMKKSKQKTSDVFRYKQRDYVVYEGSRGGRYIRLKGEYISIRALS